MKKQYDFCKYCDMRSRDNNPVKWTSAIYSMKIDGKMTIMGNTNYMRKILRLPIEFFAQRMSGDIVSRQKTNASITSTIVNTIASLLLNTIMMFVYLWVISGDAMTDFCWTGTMASAYFLR